MTGIPEPPDHYWVAAIRDSDGEEVTLWDGGGRVANPQGDLYGNTPRRLIKWGHVTIEADRLAAALEAGWHCCADQPPEPEDPDDTRFANIHRDERERPADAS